MDHDPGRQDGCLQHLDAAECIVAHVLEGLYKENFISGFIHSPRNGCFDSSGIDFLIMLHGGLAFPIQVKRRQNGARCRKMAKRHLRKHPQIGFIIFVDLKRPRRNRFIEWKLRKGILRAVYQTSQTHLKTRPA